MAEASVAERVAGHPRQVRLVDAAFDPVALVFLFVYESGGVSLETTLKHDGSSVNLRRLARHAFEGLERLHSLGLYHSDLKPANILVQAKADCETLHRIADLGGMIEVGFHSHGVVRLAKTRCTLNFRAPELLEGRSKPRARSGFERTYGLWA